MVNSSPLTAKKKINGIQSIEVGFSIIAVLVNSNKPLSLKLISERSGLTPSKIHSYLVSFINLGLVTQDEETGFYSLGTYSLILGFRYLDQVDLFGISKPFMDKLSVETGQTVFLGVWGNKGPTIVNRVDGHYSQTIFDLRMGSVLPLLTSALGKNFAAHMPEHLIRPFLLEEIEKNKNRADIPKSLSETYTLLDEVRKNGISQSQGQLLTDYTALSVPVFDYSNQICAGITLMGRIESFDDRLDGRIANLMKETSKDISKLRSGK